MKEIYLKLREILGREFCPILFDDADFEELVLLDLFVRHMHQSLHRDSQELTEEAMKFWLHIIKNDPDLITDRLEGHLYYIAYLKTIFRNRCETIDCLPTDVKIMLLKNFQYYKPLR